MDVKAVAVFAVPRRYVIKIRDSVLIPTRVRRIAMARTAVRMAVMEAVASVMPETPARRPDNVFRQIREARAPAVARVPQARVVTA